MIGLDELILQVKESSTSTATFQGKLGKSKQVLFSMNLKNLHINITFSSPQPMQLRNILQCKVSNDHQRKVENQNENKKTLGTLLLLNTTIIINVKKYFRVISTICAFGGGSCKQSFRGTSQGGTCSITVIISY